MAWVGRWDLVLTRGCAPQMKNTPLYVAAKEGHLEVVQLLVQAHADKDAPSKVREEG